MRIPFLGVAMYCALWPLHAGTGDSDWHKEKLFAHAFMVRNCRTSFEEYSRTVKKDAVPRNGLHLDLDVVIHEDAIRLQWKMWYTGKRNPLITVRPSLPSHHLTLVIRSGGGREMVELRSTSEGGPDGVDKEGFLQLPAGKKALGHIDLPKKELLQLIAKYMFVDPRPDMLIVQLVHHPSERGGDLDAWTGEVRSNVVHVKLPK